MPEQPLRNRVDVVAGATRGAGRGIARMLGAAGATVYCTGRSVRGRPATPGRPETIEETATLVTAEGGRGIAVRTDHTVESAVEQLFARVHAEAGRLNVLVNDIWGGDALTEWGRPFWELTIAQLSFENMLRSNDVLPILDLHGKGGPTPGPNPQGEHPKENVGGHRSPIDRTGDVRLSCRRIPGDRRASRAADNDCRQEDQREHNSLPHRRCPCSLAPRPSTSPRHSAPACPQAQQQQQEDRFKAVPAARETNGIHLNSAARLSEKAEPPQSCHSEPACKCYRSSSSIGVACGARGIRQDSVRAVTDAPLSVNRWTLRDHIRDDGL